MKIVFIIILVGRSALLDIGLPIDPNLPRTEAAWVIKSSVHRVGGQPRLLNNVMLYVTEQDL